MTVSADNEGGNMEARCFVCEPEQLWDAAKRGVGSPPPDQRR
ncbi:hypothetical protein [Mycobacterium sp.]|nr:hypothetical protein [Mycobacterium sp.]